MYVRICVLSCLWSSKGERKEWGSASGRFTSLNFLMKEKGRLIVPDSRGRAGIEIGALG
jgi:hypothetical protein